MTKKGGEKRKREGEKEENKTGTVKIICDGSASVEAFEFFVKGDIWRVVAIFGETFWISLRTCLIVNLRLGWWCQWCLM